MNKKPENIVLETRDLSIGYQNRKNKTRDSNSASIIPYL